MRRTIGIVSVLGLIAVAVAGVGASPLLADFAKSINDAKSLSTTYRVQPIGDTATMYSLDLKKPNLARIDEPDKLIVADGNQITTYNKADKTYYHEPETPQALQSLFVSDEMSTWSGFFTPNAYTPVDSQDLGTVSIGANQYDAVKASYGKSGNKSITYYLNPDDKVARRVAIDLTIDSDKKQTVLLTKTLEINGPEKDDLFAFTAPDGSKEISLADMMASKWYTNLQEAEKIAQTTHRKIFVDFFATWCGPCKMLQAQVLETGKFKEIASKKLVLLRIDVDAQPDVSQQFGIEAMPTQMVLNADGTVINKIVGYGGPDMFYSFLNPILGN